MVLEPLLQSTFWISFSLFIGFAVLRNGKEKLHSKTPKLRKSKNFPAKESVLLKKIKWTPDAFPQVFRG